MDTIVLISCVKKKVETPEGPIPAMELYDSTLFKESLRYAREVLNVSDDRIFILSAEHHLLPLDKRILKYEKTLNNATSKEIEDWASIVWKQLSDRFGRNTKYIILAGKKYHSKLIREGRISNYDLPLDGLPMGKRIQALQKANKLRKRITK